MRRLLRFFPRSERGQSIIEYVLVVAFVTFVIAAVKSSAFRVALANLLQSLLKMIIE